MAIGFEGIRPLRAVTTRSGPSLEYSAAVMVPEWSLNLSNGPRRRDLLRSGDAAQNLAARLCRAVEPRCTGVGCRSVTRGGCLRGCTGLLRFRRFRRPCGSRPEGLARKGRRPLRSRVPRTPRFRPEARQALLAWRSERPRRQRRRRCRQNSMVHSACCFLVMGDRPISGDHCVNAAARLPILRDFPIPSG